MVIGHSDLLARNDMNTGGQLVHGWVTRKYSVGYYEVTRSGSMSTIRQ